MMAAISWDAAWKLVTASILIDKGVAIAEWVADLFKGEEDNDFKEFRIRFEDIKTADYFLFRQLLHSVATSHTSACVRVQVDVLDEATRQTVVEDLNVPVEPFTIDMANGDSITVVPQVAAFNQYEVIGVSFRIKHHDVRVAYAKINAAVRELKEATRLDGKDIMKTQRRVGTLRTNDPWVIRHSGALITGCAGVGGIVMGTLAWKGALIATKTVAWKVGLTGVASLFGCGVGGFVCVGVISLFYT